MARRKKLLIIIILSMIFTYIIYFANRKNKINLVALGDGIASGETSFSIDGISFNDYIKEYFEKKKILNSYNSNYALKNYKISDLINDINENDKKGDNKLFLKQFIYKADIITICIGEEELIKMAITKDLDVTYIKKYLNQYDDLLSLIKENTEAIIIIIGFYENNYLDKSNIIILNSELANLTEKYDAIFINISDLLLNKDYFSSKDSYYFNYKGHEKIAEMIINSL